MSPKMAAWLQSEDWPSLGYYRETYPETALTNRKRAQKLEEIKQTLIPGKRNESLARSENRGTSTERRTLSSIQRSEEHTSELQSRQYLVCRLLLEKKKNTTGISLNIRLN